MTQPAPYHRPTSLAEALDLLANDALRVAAGCTDLFPATERKTLPGTVLDITNVAGLRGISPVPDGLLIGATTTWSDLINAPLPAACNGLKLAAREVGATQIQNRGTIAGNLCNASPAADGVPPLLTLDAKVRLQSQTDSRQVPLADFITGPRQTALEPGELVTGIFLPSQSLEGQGHFLKLGARRYLIISIAMTAVRLAISNGIVAQAAVAIGSCGPVATRLRAVEKALIGFPLDPSRVTDAMVADAISPIDDVRADAAYRAHAAAELLRRTLIAMPEEQAAA
ncbi:FAD binding domain-containing protein [bacterium]|nr:FAD binding domain-containing protein [bacterium]